MECAVTDIYDHRGRLMEEPDTEWYRENWGLSDPPTPAVLMASDEDGPELIRYHGVNWVFTAEGQWLGFSGATVALEVYEEAERRYGANAS